MARHTADYRHDTDLLLGSPRLVDEGCRGSQRTVQVLPVHGGAVLHGDRAEAAGEAGARHEVLAEDGEGGALEAGEVTHGAVLRPRHQRERGGDICSGPVFCKDQV